MHLRLVIKRRAGAARYNIFEVLRYSFDIDTVAAKLGKLLVAEYSTVTTNVKGITYLIRDRKRKTRNIGLLPIDDFGIKASAKITTAIDKIKYTCRSLLVQLTVEYKITQLPTTIIIGS